MKCQRSIKRPTFSVCLQCAHRAGCSHSMAQRARTCAARLSRQALRRPPGRFTSARKRWARQVAAAQQPKQEELF